jgi:hypothetical protein
MLAPDKLKPQKTNAKARKVSKCQTPCLFDWRTVKMRRINPTLAQKSETGYLQMVNATRKRSDDRRRVREEGVQRKCARSYVCASPRRRDRSARTSVTYCIASRMGIKWRRSLSVGSLIQPSIGIALSLEVTWCQ